MSKDIYGMGKSFKGWVKLKDSCLFEDIIIFEIYGIWVVENDINGKKIKY